MSSLINGTNGKSDFEKQIQQWVSVDDQIKGLNEKLKELREKKNTLNTNITTYASKNNIFGSTIKIGDGKLKFGTVNAQQQITLGYLQKCLGEVIKNESQAQQIFEYIKNNREVKTNFEIKRF